MIGSQGFLMLASAPGSLDALQSAKLEPPSMPNKKNVAPEKTSAPQLKVICKNNDSRQTIRDLSASRGHDKASDSQRCDVTHNGLDVNQAADGQG